MGAAYLKGHHGLARFMLDIPQVNVDFQDEEGNLYCCFVPFYVDLLWEALVTPPF